jgi:hypothetical protein
MKPDIAVESVLVIQKTQRGMYPTVVGDVNIKDRLFKFLHSSIARRKRYELSWLQNICH